MDFKLLSSVTWTCRLVKPYFKQTNLTFIPSLSGNSREPTLTGEWTIISTETPDNNFVFTFQNKLKSEDGRKISPWCSLKGMVLYSICSWVSSRDILAHRDVPAHWLSSTLCRKGTRWWQSHSGLHGKPTVNQQHFQWINRHEKIAFFETSKFLFMFWCDRIY